MYGKFQSFLQQELADIESAGLYKKERIIKTPQKADIRVNEGEEVLNFCANNYLGLSDHSRLIEAAKKAMDHRGYGMSSVRFICGTQDLHKQLEAEVSEYFRYDSLQLLFRRERRAFRTVARRRRCDYIGCAEPCLDYRRCASLQSQTLSLCQCRYGRP